MTWFVTDINVKVINVSDDSNLRELEEVVANKTDSTKTTIDVNRITVKIVFSNPDVVSAKGKDSIRIEVL